MKTILSFLLILFHLQLSYGQNTFYGSYAGSESSGEKNAYFGYIAGYKNSGNNNSYFGSYSGQFSAGSSNAAFGASAGSAVVGNYNAFLGNLAGANNQASQVVAIGFSAGHFNKGSYSVFIGKDSGLRNQANYNTAIGFASGGGRFEGMNGEHNTFLGAHSGYQNGSGLHNTYIGAESGRNNPAGAYNTFLGMRTGANSTGSNNVFIGYQAGKTATASHKLIIANEISNTTPLITGDFRANHVAIGGFGDPKFTLHVLGTAHTTGTFTSSDVRFKQNIEKIQKASEKLLAVDGVSYEFKPDSTRNFHQGKTYGFIAQDVQKVMPALVAADQEGYLALNYECFIPLLVEAFKEMKGEYQHLAKQNEDLQKEVESLKRKIAFRKPFRKNMDARLENMGDEAAILDNDVSAMPVVVLHQNSPNPFNRQTSIRYEVPAESQSIELSIYDQSGAPRLQYTNLPAGKSQVNIEAAQLPAGMYFYSLSVDGIVADTKRMILTQ